jgi:hypothetical protein
MPASAPVVRVTEGPLKADVAYELDPAVPCVACAGVGTWKSVLPLLEHLDAQGVHIAFDVDIFKKPGALAQLHAFYDRLVVEGYAVRIENWDADQGKGIDDLLRAGGQPRFLTVGRMTDPGTPQPARPVERCSSASL